MTAPTLGVAVPCATVRSTPGVPPCPPSRWMDDLLRLVRVLLPFVPFVPFVLGVDGVSSPTVDDPLASELREHLARPEHRSRAYEAAFILGGELALSFADGGVDDPDGMVRVWAWRMRLELDPAQRVHWIDEALTNPHWMIRRMAAHSAARKSEGDQAIDEFLERTLATEDLGLVIEQAAESHAQRNAARGARRVHELLRARGPQWNTHGLFAYAAFPTHDDAEVFRAALASDDLDRHILGARGLLALGRLDEDDPERATAALKTIREFLAYVETIDRDHGAVRTSHWDELIEDAATATVVVIGEAHASASGSEVQSRLLMALASRWGVDATTLGFERSVQEFQALPITTARERGVAAVALESEEEAQRSVFERDESARANLLAAIRNDPNERWVVIYGDSHRASFVHALRAAGVRVVSVTTSGKPTMLRAAWNHLGTLRISGRVFHFDDGTYFVANGPDLGDP